MPNPENRPVTNARHSGAAIAISRCGGSWGKRPLRNIRSGVAGIHPELATPLFSPAPQTGPTLDRMCPKRSRAHWHRLRLGPAFFVRIYLQGASTQVGAYVEIESVCLLSKIAPEPQFAIKRISLGGLSV